MRMTETELFDYLNKVFPEKIIYTDQYRLGAYLPAFADVRKYAKAEGLSSAQWLTNRGFIWRETGYVESDMRIRNTHELSPECSAFDLADYVFRTYPLVGEYHLTNSEDTILYQSASQTVKKVLLDMGRTTAKEDAVLVLETINLLKGWSSELADDENSGSLWNYIFLQYGFKSENSDAATNKLYNYFRSAIKDRPVTRDSLPQREPSDIIHHYYSMLWHRNKALNLYILFCSIFMLKTLIFNILQRISATKFSQRACVPAGIPASAKTTNCS